MATEKIRQEEMSETEQMVETESLVRKDSSAITPDIADPVVEVENLNLKYGEKQALYNVNLEIPKNEYTLSVCNVLIDRFGKRVRFLENHSDPFSQICYINCPVINIISVYPYFPGNGA